MRARLGRRWWVLLLQYRLPRRLRSVSSGEVHLSTECCGRGWRRRSSLHLRSLGCEARRGLVRIGIPPRRNRHLLPGECVVGRMEGIRETKVVPQESPLPEEVTGVQVVVVVGLSVGVIVGVVFLHSNGRLLPEECGQTGRRA